MMILRSVQTGGLWHPINDDLTRGLLSSSGGLYDRDTVEAALAQVTDFTCAVDAGAHLGMIAKQLSGRFERVVCFEPDEEMFRYLRLNTDDLGNVRSFRMALGSKVGLAGLSHVGVQHNSMGYVVPATEQNWVPMLELDVLDLKGVGLLKIDVEGYELEVIQGAMETMLRCRPVVVIEENWCAERYERQRTAAHSLLTDIGMVEKARIEYQPGSVNIVMAWPPEPKDL